MILFNYKTGQFLRELSDSEVWKYYEMVDTYEGVVPGEPFGYGFLVYAR